MNLRCSIAAVLAMSLVAVPSFAAPQSTQSAAATSSRPQAAAKKHHRVVIQVSENDPKVMNLALNNAENLTHFYEQSGETVQIEIVAYGPGLNMVRSDTSPVKDRLASLGSHLKHVTFSGCGNTMEKQSKQESKNISLLPEAHVVPTGIARIVELEEQGWTYIRP
jgi:uncharacterized protein